MIRLTSATFSSGSTSGSLVIQAVSGNNGPINASINDVKVIQFNNNTGFSIVDNGDGKVFINIEASNINSGILVLDASDDSPELGRFLDLIENPCNYKGRVVYLTAVGPTQRPDPFLWADKFYFNEGCEWHESPFALGALLGD